MGRTFRGWFAVAFFSLTMMAGPSPARAADKDDASAIVITFKDGHQQSYSLGEIARIEFKSPAATAKTPVDTPSRHHFVGKWTVGDNAGHTYVFTLEEGGAARNNVDEGGKGTWNYTNGEAHIAWDNGWHDVIRKVGMKYRKFAFAPGRSLDDSPTNEGTAQKDAEPI